MCRKDFSYTYNHRGYMVHFKGQSIGGAGILKSAIGPRGKAAISQARDYASQAEITIQSLLSGRGSKFMIDNIAKIDAKNKSNQIEVHKENGHDNNHFPK